MNSPSVSGMKQITQRSATAAPQLGNRHRLLLYCSLFASLWYVAVNLIVPNYYPGYDFRSQTISELSAIGAPTRELWNMLCAPYSPLILAFGWGLWLSAGEERKLRVVAICMIIAGISGFFWAPMHQRTVLAAGGGTWTDTVHLTFAAISELVYIISMVYAAWALNKTFRFYTLITFIVLMFFGYLTFREAPLLSQNLPTPNLGIWERINIGVFHLWIVVLAVVLMRRKKAART